MELSDDLETLELSDQIFKGVKYIVSGSVNNKVLELLTSGGATRLNYFSDYVTHLICGDDADENDLGEANEIYEIPVISPKWVFMCTKLKKLLNPKGYIFSNNKLFSKLVFCFSKLSKDRNALWAIITYHGGQVQLNLNEYCTHLVTTDITSEKFKVATELEPERIIIITPDWILETVRNNQYVPTELYHPKLILWPKIVKHESTTAITGFEPEQSDFANNPNENNTTDSTQALLDKLKQRMPWNQPQSTTVATNSAISSSTDIIPPNVVAPTYTGPKIENNQLNLQQLQQRIHQHQQLNLQQQSAVTSMFPQNQTSLTPNQVPRSIVHHTPQVSQATGQFVQSQPNTFSQTNTNQIGFNRILDQLHQQRPNIQGQIARLGQQQYVQQVRSQLTQATNQQQMSAPSPSTTPISQQQIVPQSTTHVTPQIGQPQILQQGIIQRHILRPNLQNNLQLQLANRQLIGQQNQLLQQQLQQGQIGQPQVAQQINPNQIQSHINQQQQQQQHQQINTQQLQQPIQNQLSQQLNQNQGFQTAQQIVQNQNYQQQPQQQPQNIIQQNQPQVIQQSQVIQQAQVIQQGQPQVIQQAKIIQNQFNQQQIITSAQNQQPQNIVTNQQQFTNTQFAFNQQQQTQIPTQPVFNQQQQQQQQQLIQSQQQNQFNQNQGINTQLLPQHPQQQPPQQVSTQQIINQQVGGQQIIQQVTNQQMINQQLMNSQQQNIPLINQQSQPMQTSQTLIQSNQAVQFNQVNVPNQTPQHRPINQMWQQQQQQQQQQVPQPQQQPPTPQQTQQQPQQPSQPQQQIIRQPGSIVHAGPRLQWSPNQQAGVPQRQFIHLDAQTHQQLQQMAPQERALFVAKLQKQRQLILQRQQLQMQQQRGGQIVIRSGSVPPGLNPQQQVQWIHQQAKQQGVVLQSNIQQQNLTSIQPGSIQHAPGLSPIQQNQSFSEQNPQLQLQRQQLRLQQMQLQREQAQKNAQNITQPGNIQQNIVRPIGQPQPVDINAHVIDSNVPQNNAKAKTALANMLSIRLQSGGSNISPATEPITEPSAAGTLRLMTAQHNAALNSNNRPQELLALQQRRPPPVNGPTTELVRPPGPPSVPPSPQDPQKLQYSPRSNIPIQHRPGPFYGHNPNLKLPPDLFLLGCIFVVVELERFLEESLPGWQQKIEKHGGEIEKQYCNRVTHVLCETQRHGVVMQAIRDYKRCVTLYWLSDVINRKQVLPPWTALHLPMMYLDTAPASKHLISLCGFTGTERNRVKHMIKYIGATFTSYFSKHNTLLIAAKVEGPKYLYAKKWGTPIVNIQWLTDVMLGNFSALNQTEHIKYQQFSNPPNFSFDPMLVPNLMHSWKMPINISQESYEKVKRSTSPVVLPKKIKRLKTEQTDENENQEDTTSMPVTCGHRILFSMCNNVEELKKIVRQLGGSIAKSHKDCTHLVMPQLARTNKLLYCVCLGTHILPDSWLRDSAQANKFLDESNYSLDTKEFNTEYKCDFQQTLNTKNRNRLFEGKFFFITPSVYPNKKVLTELIQNCSGIVEKNRRSISQIEATNINSPYSYVILTHETDLHLVADLLRNKKEKIRIVCNVELILSAILRQTFEVEPYAVKVL